jgi:hypothetical protein
MQMRTIGGAWLVVAALCSAGCGLTDEIKDEPAEPTESTTESETTVWCSHKAWRVDFYSEPELVNVVGWLKCNCWQPQTRAGTTTNYLKLAYEIDCSQ